MNIFVDEEKELDFHLLPFFRLPHPSYCFSFLVKVNLAQMLGFLSIIFQKVDLALPLATIFSTSGNVSLAILAGS